MRGKRFLFFVITGLITGLSVFWLIENEQSAAVQETIAIQEQSNVIDSLQAEQSPADSTEQFVKSEEKESQSGVDVQKKRTEEYTPVQVASVQQQQLIKEKIAQLDQDVQNPERKQALQNALANAHAYRQTMLAKAKQAMQSTENIK